VAIALLGLLFPGSMPGQLAIPPASGGDLPPASGGDPVLSVGGGNPVCSPNPTPTPSSVLDPIGGPNGSLGAGGTLTLVIEFGEVNATSSAQGVQVKVPSLF